VSLSRSVDAILGPWREQRRYIVIVAALLELALAVSIALVFRHRKGRERLKILEASLVKAEIDRAVKAKADGRNCFRFFEPTLDERRRVLEQDLRRAVENNEFQIFYQPVINARSGRICAFEALLRWCRTDGSNIPPNDFIPAAEKMGLIHSLGRWALISACRETTRWPADVSVAVNLSPLQIARHDLVDTVREALDASGLAPKRLQLEITEGSLLEDVAETVSTFHRLKDLGVSIAMDDFGTGYSSLNYLLKFAFDKVKLDRSLIAEVEKSDQSNVVVRSIITMCNGLGMRTTAEGVETQEQLAFLRKDRCMEAQGFLISKAVNGEQAAGLLARRPPAAREGFGERSELVEAREPETSSRRDDVLPMLT
jgi:EAL domain-containing protein (putative c-di-GMP-specific phosphodiesterase class I)